MGVSDWTTHGTIDLGSCHSTAQLEWLSMRLFHQEFRHGLQFVRKIDCQIRRRDPTKQSLNLSSGPEPGRELPAPGNGIVLFKHFSGILLVMIEPADVF